MKKITMMIAALLLLAGGQVMSQDLNVQNVAGVLSAERNHVSAKTPSDTMFIDDFFSLSTNFYNYLAPGSGYIFGPHWDTAGQPRAAETAQGYLVLGSFGVEGALIWVARKSQTSVNGSQLYVKLYNKNGTSSYTIGGTPYTIDCPNTVLGRDTIEWADIDTSGTGWTIASFNPVLVTNDFVIGLDVSNFYANGDTLSVIGGEGAASGVYGLEYTWYKYPNPSLWVQFSHIWSSGGNPLDAAIAIFPIIDENFANVNDGEYFMGMKLSQNFPNPSNGITRFEYAIENAANVSIEIIDQNGRRVQLIEQGYQAPGTYNVTLSEPLASGLYYYSLITDGKRLTKKMSIK